MDHTPEKILAKYADDVAFVVEDNPVVDLCDLGNQLLDAVHIFKRSGINGFEDIRDAVTFIDDAEWRAPDAAAKQVLLNQVADRLKDLPDMVAEYRLAVA
ncbi:hypothetical protein [Streptomyces showdoensis]|uniref:Uncharacterized protein n=1 Tax=Streptomyces showdoensis TaxID=68268 RepID=A0A2P2GKL5_STREW|nr:hypothetical protein [Streptomyces showdoensis]KKZ72048.1 hypothetical protein VO63_19860 [Streptomyces showdoensis]